MVQVGNSVPNIHDPDPEVNGLVPVMPQLSHFYLMFIVLRNAT